MTHSQFQPTGSAPSTSLTGKINLIGLKLGILDEFGNAKADQTTATTLATATTNPAAFESLASPQPPDTAMAQDEQSRKRYRPAPADADNLETMLNASLAPLTNKITEVSVGINQVLPGFLGALICGKTLIRWPVHQGGIKIPTKIPTGPAPSPTKIPFSTVPTHDFPRIVSDLKSSCHQAIGSDLTTFRFH